MKQGEQKTGTDLIGDALSLLISCRDLPREEQEANLAEWGNRSPAHSEALETARHEWSLFDELEDEPLNAGQMVRLAGETLVATMADHPGKTAGAFTAMSAALLLLLSPLVVQNEPSLDPTWMQLASHQDTFERHVTKGREQRQLLLSTGATVWLNWNSEILVAEHEDIIHVEVVIGDALFLPPKQESKPVIIRSGEVVAYAPETEFTIHSHGPQDAFFQVKSGVVTIGYPETSSTKQLNALQQTYVFEGNSGRVRPANYRTIGAWQDGKVILENRPLLEVLYELTHYTAEAVTVGEISNANAVVSIDIGMEEADKTLAQLADDFLLEFVKGPENKTMIRSLDARRL